ncbi:MAG: hypothetical protein RLZZ184_4112, partial [Cyanobacteriota bacterium]
MQRQYLHQHTAVPGIHKVQILMIKLLWCGQDARIRCT